MGLLMFLKILLLSSLNANAEDVGQFTFLGVNEPAPFEGLLLDPIATADVIVARSFSQETCDLRLTRALEKKEIDFQLERDNFQISYDVLRKEYDLVLEQKDSEIEQLQDTLKKHSSRNKWWWFAGGVASGMVVTYGAYWMFNEVQ